VEPSYSKTYKNFKNVNIFQFRQGSTWVESNIYFNSSGPNVTTSEVKKTFLNGLSTLDFTVIPNSIDVTQTF
ncbi:cell wall protein DAN4-like, partial [Clarias magur]